MVDSEDKKSLENSQKTADKIIPTVIEDEMKQSYLDYAMSVIIGRALPDVRDGLKPVHRRILFGMNELANFHNKPFKKSARIVGEILGKFHPHGDVAVYDSIVRMAQDFSLRYPLVDGQGNFGSIDGDSAAAMRYSEVRLGKLSEELLEDLNLDTVDFVPNFDNTLKEPTVLPCKVPNLLINGSAGIAVGMATNIPPHNIKEVCQGVINCIDKPEIRIAELSAIIKGPDFPTSGIILGRAGIKDYLTTGRGKVIVRAKINVEDKRNKQQLIVTEIPYQINKSQLIEEIADMVRNKVIVGISDLKDESNREGIRIVMELKQGTNSDVVQNQLFKHTRLQDTFGVIMLSLVNNEPKVLNIKEMIVYFIAHRKIVITRRTQFLLKNAQDKAHILEGLIIALKNIDDVIARIKKSKQVDEAKAALIKHYSLSEPQAKAILEMRLQRLAALEQEKIKDEHKATLEEIKELTSILKSEQRILDLIKKDMDVIINKYGDERRTNIVDDSVEIESQDLIKEENVAVTCTHSGYIKKLSLEEYRQQRRGGKGVIAADMKDTDFVEDIFVCSTHDYLLLFTNKGKVHWMKVYDIPTASKNAKGRAINNLLNIGDDEKIATMIPIKNFDDKHYLIMATKNGIIKKTNLMEYSNPRKGGIAAIDLEQNDSLINVQLSDGTKEIVLGTKNGFAIRFKETDVRSVGRVSKGVIGCTFKGTDEVIGMEVCNEKDTLLTIAENGHGKRSLISDYRLVRRGGVGVINIKVTERNGKVVSIKTVVDEDEMMFISQKGIIIRVPVRDISVYGRATQGVRIMKLDASDKVVAAAKIAREHVGI